MRITFTLLLFLFILRAPAQDINTAKLDSFFNALGDHNKSMGSFAVAKNGKLVYQRSLGYKSLRPDTIRASSATQYRIGSITKVFTATMIFQLIDEGKLSLDTKLSKYFPRMPNAEKITVLDLLSHTSGLMDYVNDVTNKGWITNPHPKAELLDTIAKRNAHFDPGTKQQYSNSGYLLMAYILEEITGKPYSRLLEVRVLKKIGLKNTSSGIPNNSGKTEARPYAMISNWTDRKDIYFPNVIGVGDILSTPADLLTFMNALSSGKLVSPKSYAQMSAFKDQNQFAMGLLRVPFYDQTGLGHNGGTYGSYSVLYSFKESGISIASCINGLNYPLNDISVALLSISNGKSFQIPSFKEVVLKKEELDSYLGIYASTTMPIKITFTKNGTSLVAQATGQAAFPLEAVAKDKFKFDGAGIVIEFNAEKQEMALKQGGQMTLFTKEKK
ncbi:serine hydrolase domain-containing protein [Pedobacter nyackensis]|uniref:CubicO group peptidase, beta-lactamase class C family n=1 Tax=Pedobacter nyackensis TaxID=475255 RepID=A0A1W2AL51_9SPHI|nr:serine hydrolase domain-containing protein [Pedobacter nyackensis]SMC61416.1 CubicO group peptidase, beta-lactamase class C family [Pedobacter nyackensis]